MSTNYIEQLADEFIRAGWQQDQHGQWFDSSQERVDFQTALARTVERRVRAELARRAERR